MTATATPGANRVVRFLEVRQADASRVADAIEDMYNDTLDCRARRRRPRVRPVHAAPPRRRQADRHPPRYHYPLSLYSELAPLVDTRTLVSWVATLRKPDAGGDLLVYGVTSDTADAPKMPNGFQYDLAAIEQRYHSARFTPEIGDFFLLASGRCLHRVEKIAGPRARVTMGGFLALAKDRSRVLFWS